MSRCVFVRTSCTLMTGPGAPGGPGGPWILRPSAPLSPCNSHNAESLVPYQKQTFRNKHGIWKT